MSDRARARMCLLAISFAAAGCSDPAQRPEGPAPPLGPEPARNAYRVRVEDPPAAGCVMVLRFVERRGRKCVVRGSWYDGEISEKEASSGSEATDFFGVTRIVLRCDRRRTIAHVRFGDDVSSPDLTGAKWRKEPAWQPSVGGEAVFFLRADRAPFRVSDGPRDF